MKINEFEKPQINEGVLDASIGDVASAGLKSMFNPGVTKQAQLHSDLFFKDFVADAIVSLQNAVKSGLVVPSTAAPAEKKKTDPVEKKTNAALTDPYENLKGQIRRLQPKPNAKPLPNNLVVKLNGDMEKLATGDKESGTYVANEILKLASDGYDVSKLTTIWNAKSKIGEKFLTQSVYRAITNMLREHGLTWDNLGLRIRLYEGARNSGVFLSRCNPIPVATPEFKKMDFIFEGIVTELFEGQPDGSDQSISRYMMGWFGKWMDGVNWAKRKPQVQSLIDAIEIGYPNGNWKGAIRQLAKAAFAISAEGSTPPAGLANAAAKPTDGKGAADNITDFGVAAGASNTAQGRGTDRDIDPEEQIKRLLKNDPTFAKNNPELVKKYGR